MLFSRRQTLKDLLSREVDVGVVTEKHGNHRQTELGYRLHSRHSGNPVHLILDWESDELLDFLRRQPLGVGVDFHLHWGDIWKRIDIQAVEGQYAAGDDKH